MKKTKESSIKKTKSKKSKSGNDLNDYLAIQKEVPKTLPNINIDKLFKELDKNKFGGKSIKEMAGMLMTVNKPVTTKNIMKQVDLEEWIKICVASVISDAGPPSPKKIVKVKQRRQSSAEV